MRRGEPGAWANTGRTWPTPGAWADIKLSTPALPPAAPLLAGQRHDSQKPSIGTVHELDGTAVRARYPVHHGQSESRPGLASGDVFPRERLDQRFGTAGANTGAPIRDGDDDVIVVISARSNFYFLLSVAHPVIHQIRDEPPDGDRTQVCNPYRPEHHPDIVAGQAITSADL